MRSARGDIYMPYWNKAANGIFADGHGCRNLCATFWTGGFECAKVFGLFAHSMIVIGCVGRFNFPRCSKGAVTFIALAGGLAN